MVKEKEAFQDLIGPENHCHGCGCANENGLQIKSYWDGDGAVATYWPKPHQCAGSPHYVNGGILASLIDCHGNNTAMATAYHRAGRKVGSLPKIWCVTAKLDISYKAPVSMGKELLLRSRITKQEGRKTWLEVNDFVEDKLCVQAELLQIEVKRED